MLAPMVGITNRAFRTLVSELGPPDFAFTEMASAEAFISRAQYESYYTDPRPCPHATSIQFYARSAEAMAAACALVSSRPPETRPAGIDLNFGCSAPHIRRAGGGSAWSDDPEGASALVTAARKAWDGLLSVKLRLGTDDDYERLLSFCMRLADAGIDFLTLHPRMDGQKFRRRAKHKIIGRLARDLDIPVIANGDITDPETAAYLLNDLGAHAVMLGREAVRRPWIFSMLRDASAVQTRDTAIDTLMVGRRFIDLVEEMLPPAWRLETCRRFFSYFCDSFSFAHHFKYRVMNSSSLEGMRANLADYFSRVPGDQVVHR